MKGPASMPFLRREESVWWGGGAFIVLRGRKKLHPFPAWAVLYLHQCRPKEEQSFGVIRITWALCSQVPTDRTPLVTKEPSSSELGLWSQPVWVWIPAHPFKGCVTLGNYLISLCFTSCMCKMSVIIILLHRVDMRIKSMNMCKALEVSAL